MANSGSEGKWSMKGVRAVVGKLGEMKSTAIRFGHKIKATLTRAN